MKTVVLSFIFMVFGIMQGAAENPAIVKDAVTVNNLQVGEHYTREQFIQTLGIPTKVMLPTEESEYRNAYTFYFGEDRFYWIDGEFYGFELKTPVFAVNGLIRVGDDIAEVNKLGGIRKNETIDMNQLCNWRPSDKGLYEWLSVDFYYNNKVITYISAFIQDL
ncbi:hypothetical protein [uncultured Alistipes sp.]|jgi:hypothetical protein|uniref:hypothetical protein n=1 Tax=uncultured Alistipes sp. TaxID=538949 RepID=UPI0025FE070F|nr:hypothetical protein [uncultured Alistipes sp.]